MKSYRLFLRRLPSIVSSNKFFWFIVALLVVQAVWIAASAIYPMAFDEDFHLGLIRLYAGHISPFWAAHPAGADAYGPLTRDPSYFYHYLMSFPYRIIRVLTGSEAAQVMILRAINIALLAWGVWLYRKLLLKTGASRALVHLSLLVFVLIPIVPYLGGQINYDNLFIPLTAIVMLLALKIHDSITAKSIDVRDVLVMITLLLFTSIVKYAFLPVAVAIVLYLCWRVIRIYPSLASLNKAFVAGTRIISKPLLAGLLLALLLFTGLFVERYGINIVKYHSPVAECDEVLDYQHCKSYGPWYRDYLLKQNKQNFKPNPVTFTQSWLHGMWYRCFFAISGPLKDFANKGPLTLPAVGTIIFAIASLAAFAVTCRRLWRRYAAPVLNMFVITTVFYVAVLWLNVFMMYLQTGAPVAINGRYLLPIIPIVVLVAAMAVNELLASRRWLKGLVAGVVLVCYVWGGGAMTYILRSEASWYWPHSPLKSANQFLRDSAGRITPGYYSPRQYMP